MSSLKLTSQEWAWAAYDFGNSVFATSVMVVFFPLAFSLHFASQYSPVDISFYLSMSIVVSSLLVACLAPFLAALADATASRKRFLTYSILIGSTATALLAIVPEQEMIFSIILYCLAHTGFSASLIFYDSFLPDIASAERRGFLSCFGYGIGYLGGGLLLGAHLLVFQSPDLFGLSSQSSAFSVVFLTSALWWMFFSLPLRKLDEGEGPARQHPQSRLSFTTLLFDAFFDVLNTVERIRKRPEVWLFLLAFWVYIDGVYSIMKLAMNFGQSLRSDSGAPLLSSESLVQALLLTQFIAFPMALIVGRLGRIFGEIPLITFCLVVYLLTTISALFLAETWHFFALAALIGCVQGGVQALSRSYFANLIQDEGDSGKYFAFFNLISKFATILGPLLYGVMTSVLGYQRLGVLSLGLLFIVGIALLRLSTKSLKHAVA
jgi:UMF1 family MFS transporter